ncbi:MAG: aminotransferase class V-fold PLP-dependent enzyme [Bacteroidota bacterium]
MTVSFHPDQYRPLFPFLKNGTIYLDHASIGPVPAPARTAMELFLHRRSESDINVFQSFLKVHAQAKQRIGRLLNAGADRIAFCDNTSHGLNILAAGFPWKTGDRVLLTDVEFPANVYPFLNQKRHGVEIDFVKFRGNKVLLEDIEHALTPRTKILSISYVQFLNGFRADLAAIGAMCRRKHVLLSVDAIQGAGAVPIDVQAMNIDFLSCGSQKWLLNTEGTAFVYVSETMQEQIRQAYLGWLSINDFFSDFFRYRLDLDATARRYEGGTLNVGGIIGLNESLAILLDAGIPQIARHLAALTEMCVERIKDEKVEFLTSDVASERAGIVTFRPRDAKAMFEELRAKDIIVSLREGCIRLSPHFYNTRNEITRALDAAFGRT